MNKKDVAFPHDTKDKYILRCLFSPIYDLDKEYKRKTNHIVSISNNVEELIDNILFEEYFFKHQIYAVLLKHERPNRLWKAIRTMFGERCFKTESDIGGLKVGNDDFSIIVPNGRGDQTTRVAVFENRKDFNDSLMLFWTDVQGTFNIYSYDCGSVPVITLSGRYAIYYHDGFIAFEKWH